MLIRQGTFLNTPHADGSSVERAQVRTPIAGTPIARPGKAKCLYRPHRSAKGKTLSGSVSGGVRWSH